MKRLFGMLAGAVIAAAFLGPGTVTTAASAGAAHGLALLWALVFATIACWLLQDAVARISAVSGKTLGAALAIVVPGRAGLVLRCFVLLAVVAGCVAYEAGNLLGGVAGVGLAMAADRQLWTLISITIALILLWRGNSRVVIIALGALVAGMGGAFLISAIGLAPAPGALLRGALIPSVPAGSGLLVLGLIGTTVVPYNLFLGSALANQQEAKSARLGLAISIVLGGLISMAVMVAGSAISGPFSFEALAGVLSERLGAGAAGAFGWGLFAAGLSSAVTAPLAAALTARSMLSSDASARAGTAWGDTGRLFRATWLLVLLIGAAFAIADVRPIPAILLAQALNGVVLPLVAALVWLAVNDRRLMGNQTPGKTPNIALGTVVATTVLLGTRGILRSLAAVSGVDTLAEPVAILVVSVALAAVGVAAFSRLRDC